MKLKKTAEVRTPTFCMQRFAMNISQGKSGENVEDLKKKLAAAEARARDFGKQCLDIL